MTDSTSSSVTRRGLLGVFAATFVAAAPTYSNAFGVLRGAGDIRRVRMYSGRTGEQVDTIYWIEGEYIKEVMKEINHFMRDWRTGDAIRMDARTVDILAASHRLMDVPCLEPIIPSTPRWFNLQTARSSLAVILPRSTPFPGLALHV